MNSLERIEIRILPAIKEMADQKAKLLGINRSNYLRQLIENDCLPKNMTFEKRCFSYLPFNQFANLNPDCIDEHGQIISTTERR